MTHDKKMKRRAFLGLAAATTTTAALQPESLAAAEDRKRRPPRGGRILLRGATIISMDPKVGNLLSGDILVDGDRIAAVAKSIPAGSAQVVDARGRIAIPGFIDTHRHVWQTPLRAMATDWTFDEYFFAVRGQLGDRFRPADLAIANRGGLLEALDGGVTTTLDWSHNINSPDHADAAIDGLLGSGARAVFAYGNSNRQWTTGTGRLSEDVRRVRRRLDAPTARVTMAAALRGPEFSAMDDVEAEWRLARSLGLPITVHVGDGAFAAKRPMEALRNRGLLGPDLTFVHLCSLTDEQLKIVADSGGRASISPESEANLIDMPATGRLLAAGITPSLSIDIVSGASGDMFTTMRTTLAVERALENRAATAAGKTVKRSGISTTDVLSFATIEGARVLGMERRTGSLTPGKQADITLVDTRRLGMAPVSNPVGSLVMSAHSGDVEAVWVAGKTVKWAGELVGVDRRRLTGQLEEARDHLLRGTPYRRGFDWRYRRG